MCKTNFGWKKRNFPQTHSEVKLWQPNISQKIFSKSDALDTLVWMTKFRNYKSQTKETNSNSTKFQLLLPVNKVLNQLEYTAIKMSSVANCAIQIYTQYLIFQRNKLN